MPTELLPAQPRPDYAPRDPVKSTAPDPVTEAMLRSTGLVMLMGVALIHLVQIVPTFQQSTLLGFSFLALMVGSVMVAAHVVRGASTRRQLWLPVVALGAAGLAGYAFTRMLSSPLDKADVGNWSCMLGLVALFVEAALVAIAAYAMKVRPVLRPTPVRSH
jgi:hypothetical protein